MKKPRLHRDKYRWVAAFGWRSLLCLLVAEVGILPARSLSVLELSDAITAVSPGVDPDALLAQSKVFYDRTQFAEAIALLQQAVAIYAAEGNGLQQAIALSNLSLAYEKLGNWEAATQAIALSLELLQTSITHATATEQVQVIFAQVLDIQGHQQFQQGQLELAFLSWQRAAETYARISDRIQEMQLQIKQARALQAQGLYRRAKTILEQVQHTLQSEPNSILKSTTLRLLGDNLRAIGNLNESRLYLEQSLAIAQQFQSTPEITATFLSLGNTSRALSQRATDLRNLEVAATENQTALVAYQTAGNLANSPLLRVQAQLNQLRLLVDTKQAADVEILWPQIAAELTHLPLSQSKIYARINLAQSLIKSTQVPSLTESDILTNRFREIAQLLAQAVQEAKSLKDTRSESFALGNLGKIYELSEQWSDAQSLTEQALSLAVTNGNLDIAYQWQWQLGRILKAQNDRPGAIAAYSEAINSLQSLRSDLVAINPDEQFSFRESVEPIYREYVALLLETPVDNSEVSQENIDRARTAIELLQLAELDNFFRDACLDVQPKKIDEIDQQAAVIYPIILPDRLEVILSIPGQSLRHYTTKISQKEFERKIILLQQDLAQHNSAIEDFLPLAQQAYNWLIRPVENELKTYQIQTLVFIPDGALRNIPIAALHDGEKYLVEKYAIALTPGLQLLPPQPLNPEQLNALTAGLSEARQGFSALPNVQRELQQINSEVPSELLLNEEFTKTKLETQIDLLPFPVVHIATHGQFSSNAEETFILTWDGKIAIAELGDILRLRDPNTTGAIELLVLSACETAAGDNRAALGLAGVAVRSEARSTLATLWQVNDVSSATLMGQFYSELAKGNVSKAEALRRAQLAILSDRTLLTNPRYAHPYFWAAYVLVGNWL